MVLKMMWKKVKTLETTLIKAFKTHSHTMTPLMPLGNKPLENTEGKGEIAHNEQFLLSHSVFYLFE